MTSQESAPFIRVIPFQFTGKGLEYFRIWIVNLCLTVATLGIYSAWAKVRNLCYFYGNTWLDEHSFDYLADPVKILKGRLIAVAFLVIYSLSWQFYPRAGMLLLAVGLFLIPFILVAAAAFNMRYSSYRNIRFYMERDYAGAYRMFLVPLGLILLLTWAGYSLLDFTELLTEIEDEEGNTIEVSKSDFLPSLLLFAVTPFIPYLDYVRARFIVSHAHYGRKRAQFGAGIWGFYRIYIIALLLFFAITFLAAVFISLVIGVYVMLTGTQDAQSMAEHWFPLLVIGLIFFYMMLFLANGYLGARRRNLIYGNTSFDGIRLHSNLKVLPLSWLYLSNTVAIILSLGMLIPWAKVRMARYVAACTELEAKSLDDITAASDEERGALGEEMADSFDIDIGL